MTFRVRRAVRRDAETLIALVRALADYERMDPPSTDAQHRLTRDGWPESGDARFTAWLAEEVVADGVQAIAIGYAITFFTYSSFLARPTLYIEDIFILPEHRRSGAGSALFDALREEAHSRHCGRVEWVVLEWNTSAQQFYRKHGAEHLKEWQCYRLTIDER